MAEQLDTGEGNRPSRGAIAVAGAVLLGSVVLRFWALDRLPGMSGDEAWLAVQAQHLLRGEPFTLRTPTHMFINPLLFATDLVVHALWPPSGWALRLPVALWGLFGVGLFAALAWRSWRDRERVLAATALYAALPLGVAYSRFAWDPSFLLVVAPVVWFQAQRLADGQRARREITLFALGAVGCLWIHMTTAVMLVALGLGAWHVAGYSLRRMLALGLGVGLVALLLARIAGLGWHAATLFIERPVRFVSSPLAALHLFSVPGLMLTGARALSQFGGLPESPVVVAVGAVATAAIALLAWRLRTSALASDRVLAATLLFLPLPWWLASGLFVPQDPGRERYVLWLLVPLVLAIVRGRWSRPRWILGLAVLASVVSAGWLGALTQQPWPDTVFRSMRTAAAEPKVALAARIQSAAQPGTPLRVATADWWLEHPLRYLLPADAIIGRDVAAPQFLVEWGDCGARPDGELFVDARARPLFCLFRHGQLR